MIMIPVAIWVLLPLAHTPEYESQPEPAESSTGVAGGVWRRGRSGRGSRWVEVALAGGSDLETELFKVKGTMVASSGRGMAGQTERWIRTGRVVFHADLGPGAGSPWRWVTCSSSTSCSMSRRSTTPSSRIAGPSPVAASCGVLWDLAMVVLAVIHGLNGLRQVLDEYIVRPGRRVAVHTLIWIVATVLVGMGSYAILMFEKDQEYIKAHPRKDSPQR